MEECVKVWQKVSTYETIICVTDSVKKLVVEFQSDSTKVKSIEILRKDYSDGDKEIQCAG